LVTAWANHGNHGSGGQPLFKLVILRLAFGQAEPPAVIVDDDLDVIRFVEGRCAARFRHAGPSTLLRINSRRHQRTSGHTVSTSAASGRRLARKIHDFPVTEFFVVA
jgi:hypothetical protein